MVVDSKMKLSDCKPKLEKPIGTEAISKCVSYKPYKDIIHVKNMGTCSLYPQYL